MKGNHRNITEKKKMEEDLRRTHDELEARVIERTKELADANEELDRHRHHLEELVKERTIQMETAHRQLMGEIAEREKAEAHMIWLASFPEKNPNPITEVDASGEIYYQNPTLGKLFPDIKKEGMQHPWLGGLDAITDQFVSGSTQLVSREVSIGESAYQQILFYLKDARRIRIYGFDITNRRRTEDELWAVNAKLTRAMGRLRLALDAAKAGTWEWDLTTNENIWSDELWQLYGLEFKACEPSYEAWLNTIHPDDRADAENSVISAARAGKDLNTEWRVSRADGTERWLMSRGKPEFDDNGRVSKYIGIAMDISDRKHAEEEAKRNAKRFEILTSTASELLQSKEPQKLIEPLCRRVMEYLDCQAFFNYMLDEAAGKLHLNACGGISDEEERQTEWLDYDTAVCGCAARDATRIVAEHIPSTQDERTTLVKSFGIKAYACHPIFGEGGSVIGTLSFGARKRETFSKDDLAFLKAVADQVAMAMTRMKDEQALGESEERYRSLVESSPDAVIVERDDRFLYANSVALLLYGAGTMDELQRRSVLDMVHPDDRKMVKSWVDSERGNDRIPLRESRIISIDGRNVPVETVGAFIDYRGEPAEQIIIRDVTERKNRENELVRLNRTLRALRDSSQAMSMATDELLYLKEVCRIVVEDCGHAMVWIGFARDDERKSIIPAAYAGFEEGYLEKPELTWADTERGRGPTGTAIRTGMPDICRNMFTDPRFKPWRKEALKRGYASSIALPLITEGKAFGAISIYSKEEDPFTEDEIKLLQDLAGDLSLGVMTLRMREAHTKSEAALTESEERFRGIFENAAVALFHVSLDGNFIRVNKICCEITGYKKNELLRMTFREITHPDEFETDMAYYRLAINDEISSYNLEKRFVRKDGSVIWGHFSVSLERDAEGRPRYFIASVQDITARKMTEQALQESMQHYRALFEESPEAIAIVDSSGTLLNVNPAYQKLTGYEAAEVLGGHFAAQMKFISGYAPRYNDIFAHVLHGGLTLTLEVFLVDKHGGQRYSELYITPLKRAGKTDAVQLIFRDITRQKLASMALEESEERFRTLFQESPNAIVIYDTAGYMLDLNLPFEHLMGFSREEMVGRHYSEIPGTSKEIIQHYFDIFDNARAGTLIHPRDVPVARASGSIIYVDMFIAPIQKKGETAAYQLIMMDVTDRKLAAMALQESEEKLKRELAVNRALAELSETLISQDFNMKEISDKVLQKARDLTGSTYGFASIISLDSSEVVALAIDGMTESGDVVQSDEGAYAGEWERALNSREPFYDNDSGRSPSGNGTPERCIPIEKILTVPVVLGEELLGRIALANPGRDYNDQDLDTVKRIGNFYALAIQRIHYEVALEEANQTLERRVMERSMQLYQINDRLITEIEERKKAVEDLRKSELKFRTVADFTYAGEYWIDLKGNYIYMSPSCERITGYMPGEFMADKDLLTNIIYPDDRDGFIEHLRNEYIDNEPQEFSFRIVRKDGAVRNIAHVCAPVYDENREFIGRRASNRDITEQAQAEIKLREGEEVASALINTPAQPVLLIDADGVIIDANDALAKMMRLERKKIAGTSMYGLIGGDLVQLRREKIATVLASRSAVRFDERSGDAWFDTIIYPVPDHRGVITKLAIFSHDITDTRRMQKEILEISELERQRIGQDLHDSLGQKLTGVAFLAEALKQSMQEKSYPETADIEEIIFNVVDSIDHARKISSGLWTERFESHDVAQVLDELAGDTRSLFRIDCGFHNKAGAAITNKTVVTNLYYIARESLNNAIKHGKADKIDLALYDDDERIFLKISDNGKGAEESYGKKKGIGLRIMHYRAGIIGGSLATHTSDSGFTVLATLKKEFIKSYLE